MVATDTLVGIVGAAVLFAVMAGVFVYEYNNTPEVNGGGNGNNGGNLSFAEQYPFLDPVQDIDGDGTPNGVDDDVDGDGVSNASDNETVVGPKSIGSGSLGPQVGDVVAPSVSLQFMVGNGSSHVTATITVSSAASQGPVTGNFQVMLVDPSGATVATANSAAPFTQTSFTLESKMDSDPEPGTWTVRISQNSAGSGGNVAGTATIHYGDH